MTDRVARATGRLVLLAALLAPGVAVAQGPDSAEADVVALAFAWPVGMTASIDLERFRIRSAGGPPDTSAIQVAYDLEVADHADGKLILYSDYSTPQLIGLSDEEARLIQAVSSIVPSYLVSDGGELLEIHQLSEVRATMMGWLHQAFDSLPDNELETLMGQLLSEETLFALAAQEWNALVGFWVEAELEVGAAYELQAEEPLPTLGNALVPYRYEFGIYARVPCRPGGEGLDCVELIMRSYPDPEALQPHLEALVQRMMSAAGARGETPTISYESLDIENEIVVVAEPGTLIPHTLTISRIVNATMDVGGVEQVGGEHRVARYEFTYR